MRRTNYTHLYEALSIAAVVVTMVLLAGLAREHFGSIVSGFMLLYCVYLCVEIVRHFVKHVRTMKKAPRR